MALSNSDSEYEIISPFTLPVQTGNDNDVPESSLKPRPAFNFNDFPESRLDARPAFNFDDANSCVIVTNTPLADDEDDDVDDFEYGGFGSPGWLPVIRFAKPGGDAANNTITTAPTVRAGRHRPDGFNWSLPSPYEEEDAVSSADATVVSSPELAAGVYTPNGRSSSTAINLLSAAVAPVERRELDVSPLLPPRPFPDFAFSGGPGATSALRRPIAVGESAFTRGDRTVRGARAQEEWRVATAPYLGSSERERSSARLLTVEQRAALSSRGSAVGDAMCMASRAAPPGQLVSAPTPWSLDHTSYPPRSHGRRRGAIW
jgi:hypothetical protein